MRRLPLFHFALAVCLVPVAAHADKHNLQTAQVAPATTFDSTAVGGYQDMPPLNINHPIDFLNDEDPGAASDVTVNPPGEVPNVNSVANFSGSFLSGGKSFSFRLMGGDPLVGHTTNIPTKIVTVDVVLLNADGSVNTTVPVTQFVPFVLNSPNFKRADYTVGHVQFGDAVQRAEFFNHMKDNWHTNLAPVQVVGHTTVTVPFTVNLRNRGVVTPVRTWFTSTGTDGNTVVFMLQQFFNAQFSNVGVNAIINNQWTTDAMNIQLWPNTFLFSPSATPLVTRGSCCVLGFHTFFSDDSTPQNRWVSAYASWTSPGTFRNADILDVLPTSHEILESFNDPFLDNLTPRWEFPDNSGCQGNLETGDPVEVLAHPAFPVTLNLGEDDDSGAFKGKDAKFTFHPQTEALVQWFTQQGPSDAFKGAFSYPDTTALTTPAQPCH